MKNTMDILTRGKIREMEGNIPRMKPVMPRAGLLFVKRNEYRKAKDFRNADRISRALRSVGIFIRDEKKKSSLVIPEWVMYPPIIDHYALKMWYRVSKIKHTIKDPLANPWGMTVHQAWIQFREKAGAPVIFKMAKQEYTSKSSIILPNRV